ncbi:hypothetical protein LTR85_007656 [Meristemomyces frigidus]|nr:hypothetical protein LTR85_007656 [Meristemomyces frigidus]
MPPKRSAAGRAPSSGAAWSAFTTSLFLFLGLIVPLDTIASRQELRTYAEWAASYIVLVNIFTCLAYSCDHHKPPGKWNRYEGVMIALALVGSAPAAACYQKAFCHRKLTARFSTSWIRIVWVASGCCLLGWGYYSGRKALHSVLSVNGCEDQVNHMAEFAERRFVDAVFAWVVGPSVLAALTEHCAAVVAKQAVKPTVRLLWELAAGW